MRKTRGRTLLKYLYELNSVDGVKVVRNSLDQPIGLEARLLAGYLGIIARNANRCYQLRAMASMPDRNKNQALDNIKERFALEVLNNYVKKALGEKMERL
ncbi:Ribosomal RNA small subunit methyltransferase H [Gossypium arboreum]|uniref:Ribosomal RNA small subunit methyltransferase H n=1 Tax=Gossypium arboreum TaxID=29729 RepID=A0A0B0NT60_GOSAR|nr:Ribosomal RNA small subunit methyltransferase H [Gossypium arboreum]